jgi:CubicO group peptidase (beta-lactamase class C family)
MFAVMAHAQDRKIVTNPKDPSAATDAFVRTEMEKRKIPGLAIVVLREGKPVKTQGYGLADIENDIPVRTNTVFQIQSITKQFVAMAIMMLVEEGKLKVDDPVSKYLDGTPETWKTITLRHLLTHTSGIKDFINEPTQSLRLDVTEEEVLHATAPRPLNFAVGEKYAYSNTNYHLLGMIIHKLTGKTWGEFVEERICRPLGMKSTRVYSQYDVVARRARGYRPTRTGCVNGEYIAPTVLAYAGGGLLSTVEDMARWDAALYTDKLVKKATLDEMWTSGLLNNGKMAGYGFGWAVGVSHGHRFVEHGGAHMTGFNSHILRYPDDKLTVIVLANLAGANPHTIARGIASIYQPGIFAPRALTAAKDPDAKRSKVIDEFMRDVAAGKKEPRHSTEGLRANIDEDDSHEMADLLKDMRSFGFLEAEDVADRSIERNGAPVRWSCFYRLETRKNVAWHFRFWLTDVGQIADFSDRE